MVGQAMRGRELILRVAHEARGSPHLALRPQRNGMARPRLTSRSSADRTRDQALMPAFAVLIFGAGKVQSVRLMPGWKR